MKKWTRFGCFLLAALMLFGAMPMRASAAAEENAPMDIVLVLDCSRSLFYFDPEGLALNACENFVDTMPVQNVRVGVIGFGYSGENPYPYSRQFSGGAAGMELAKDASHVHEIMPISSLGTSQTRESFKQTVVDAAKRGYNTTKHDELNENLYSPAVPALGAAVDMLEKNGSADKQAAIILVSDGVEADKNGGNYDHTAVGKLAREHDWPIYCIDLSYNTRANEVEAAQKLMDEICASSGDRDVGREYCATPTDVFKAFKRIYYNIWNPGPIPPDLIREITLPGEYPFSVPVLTSESTVDIFGSGIASVTLVDPQGGETIIDRDVESDDLIAVVKEDKYYSIKMICPMDGDWLCKVDGNGSASVLITSINLQEMGLAIVANSKSGKREDLPKNEPIHVSSYFTYQDHEIHNHSIYEETRKNAVLQIRHANGESKTYPMQADSQGYYCDVTLSDFPCGTLAMRVVLEDGMFRSSRKFSDEVTFTTKPMSLELTGEGPESLAGYVNSSFDRIDLTEIFYNPDGDEVTYGLECEDRSLEFAFTEESDYMTVETGMAPGAHTVTLTAIDPDMTEPLRYTMMLNVEDRKPEPKPIDGVVLCVNPSPLLKKYQSTGTVDLSQYIQDPDGVAMTFSCTVEEGSVASASLEGSVLTLQAGEKGSTIVTVTGFDGVSDTDAKIKVSVFTVWDLFWRDNWMTVVIVAVLILLLILVLIFISKNTRVKGVWTITFEENNGTPVVANKVKISTMNIGRKKVFLLKDLLNALTMRLDDNMQASLPKYFGTQKPAAQIELKGVLFGKGFVVRKIPKDDNVRVLYGGVAKQGKVQVRGPVKFIVKAPGALGTMDTMVITFK